MRLLAAASIDVWRAEVGMHARTACTCGMHITRVRRLTSRDVPDGWATPRRLDLWSLDLDNEAEQLRVLIQMDLRSPRRPAVILMECRPPSTDACVAILESNGYLTTRLEDNGKRYPAPSADILAWHDTCAAWQM